MSTKNTTRRPWSKRKKLALLGGLPLALVALPAAAAVLFAALAGIQGQGQTGNFTAKFSSGVTPTLDASTLTVKPAGAASITGDKLALPDLTIYPGESFTVEAAVVAGAANQAGYVSGVTMPGLPAGYTATVVDGCGAKVTNSMTYVKITVQAPATQTAGAAWALTNEAGVRVTPLASASATAPAGTTCAPYVQQ